MIIDLEDETHFSRPRPCFTVPTCRKLFKGSIMKSALILIMLISIGCASVDSMDQTNKRLEQLEQRITAIEARESAQVQAQQGFTTSELTRLREERAVMEKKYTAEHPALIRMNDKINELERADEIRLVQKELKKLEDKKFLLALRYTDEHPVILKVNDDIAELSAKLDEMNAR